MAFPKQTTEPTATMGTVGRFATVDEGSVNDMMVCPYEESHVVSAGRYQSHLIECRKMKAAANDADAAPEVKDESEILMCKYNPSHHIHKSVMRKHEILCDSFYKYCMEHQRDPPSMREAEGGPIFDDGSTTTDATDTDTDVEPAKTKEEEEAERNELAMRIARVRMMQDADFGAGNTIVFSSPSHSEATDGSEF